MTSNLMSHRHGARVVCAAIKLKDGLVICGVRHFDELMRMSLPDTQPEAAHLLRGHEQGFVSNDCRWLTRSEAWDIALTAKQFDPAHAVGSQGTLYSEDLW